MVLTIHSQKMVLQNTAVHVATVTQVFLTHNSYTFALYIAWCRVNLSRVQVANIQLVCESLHKI